MNQVVVITDAPLTPLGAGGPPLLSLPAPTTLVNVQPAAGSPYGQYSSVAATGAMYPRLAAPQPPQQPGMWGHGTVQDPPQEPMQSTADVRLEDKQRGFGGLEAGGFQEEGIERPVKACACVPGWAAHERERCAYYDHWPQVWAGHHASLLSGYPLLAFRVVVNLIPQFIICIMVILDKTWVDKEAETTGVVVTDSQYKKSQEQYLFYLSNWTNIVQFFFFLHACVVTHVAINKYSPGDTAPVPCPLWVKLCWQSHSMTMQASLVVTLLYWILLADPPYLAISITQHGINVVLQIVDWLVVGTFIPVVHSVWLLLYAFCFLLFSVIHWGAGTTNWQGNNYIYGVLDWNDPAAAGTLCALVLIFVPPIFGTLWPALSIARIRLFTKNKIAY